MSFRLDFPDYPEDGEQFMRRPIPALPSFDLEEVCSPLPSPQHSTEACTCNPALNARLSPHYVPADRVYGRSERHCQLIQQLRHFMSLYKQHAQHLLSVLCSCSFTEVTHLHPPQLRLCVPKRSLNLTDPLPLHCTCISGRVSLGHLLVAELWRFSRSVLA